MPLTDTLGNVGNPYKAVDPGPRPDFMGGIVDLGRAALTGLVNKGEAVGKENSTAIQNKVAQARFDILSTQGEQPTAVDNTPAPVKDAANKLGKLNTAVQRGAASAQELSLRTETALNAMMQQYPEYKAEIFKAFEDQGLTSVAFREARATLEIDKSLTTAQATGVAATAQFAYANGIVGMDADPATAAKAGSEAIAIANETKALQELATFNKTMAPNVSQAEQDKIAANHDNTLLALSTRSFQLGANNLLDANVKLVQLAAASDPTGERMRQVEAMGLDMRAAVGRQRDAALIQWRANGGSAKGEERLLKTYDDALKNYETFFTGNFAQATQRTKLLADFTTVAKVDLMKAAPLLARLIQIPGMSNTLAEGLNATAQGAFSPEMLGQLAKEVQEYTAGGRTSLDEETSVRQLAMILQGTLKLNNLTPEEAAKAMPNLLTSVVGNRKAIIADTDVTPDDVKGYTNALFEVSDAALTITPGATLSSLFNASEAVSHPNNFVALEKAMKTPGMEDVSMTAMLSVRQASQRILDVVKMKPRVGGVFEIKYDAAKSSYVMNPSRKIYDQSVKGSTAVVGPYGVQVAPSASFEELSRNPPAAMTQLLSTMNNAHKMLRFSSKYDDTIPKGTGQVALGKYYAEGTAIPGMEPKVAKPEATFEEGIAAVKKAGIALEEQITQSQQSSLDQIKNDVTVSAGTAGAVNFFQGRGWSPAATAGIVGNLLAESNLNPMAEGDKGLKGGSSMGISQWRESRLEGLKAFAKKTGGNVNDFNTQLRYIDEELQTTESKAGAALLASKTPEEAARAFALYFLRPKGAETGRADNIDRISERVSNANKVFRG